MNLKPLQDTSGRDAPSQEPSRRRLRRRLAIAAVILLVLFGGMASLSYVGKQLFSMFNPICGCVLPPDR